MVNTIYKIKAISLTFLLNLLLYLANN